jgi:hypothetical protein
LEKHDHHAGDVSPISPVKVAEHHEHEHAHGTGVWDTFSKGFGCLCE